MNILSWFIPNKLKSASQLYKEKKDKEIIEALKRIEFTVTDRGGMSYIGISEYGARKMLEEGKSPHKHEKVLLKNGELISWEKWKEINQ